MAPRTDGSYPDELSRPDDTARPADAGIEPDGSAAAGGLNVFTAVSRRWPLVLVGALCGLVFGFLYHLQRQPIYQSSAQLLVIKKRTDALGTGTTDTRQQYLEDIVSTQVTLLKSEQILMSAARLLNPQEVRVPLPPADRERAGMIAAGLTVTRDKDTSGANGGSGVLVLSYRAVNPDTSKAMLDAVIKAYQAELTSIYDETSRDRMRYLENVRRVRESSLEKILSRCGELRDEVRKITEEDLASIKGRVSAQRDKEVSLELEKVTLEKQLEVARSAGKDKRRRTAAVFMLNSMARLTAAGSDRLDMTGPEAQLKILQLEWADQRERLGDHHPTMRSLERKIGLLKDSMPRGEDGDTDELWAIEQRLTQQKSIMDDSLIRIKALIASDRDVLVQAGRLQDEANQLAEQAVNLGKDISDIKKQYADVEATSSSGGYAAKVITEPAAGWKVAPVLLQSLMIGVVLGLMAGSGLAVLAEVSDQGFRSPADVRRRLGLPVIGHLPRLNPLTALADSQHPNLDANLVVIHKPKSTEAEAYRGVRTQLYFSTQGRGHMMIQVTSPNPGDGKSTLAANLAASVAQSGKRTIIVDCDLRKPRVHKVWNLANPEIGMSAVVVGEADLRDVVQKSEIPNLDILPCGPRPANPAELLTSPAFVETLEKLRKSYDFVILDTPPMLAVSDPAVVAPRVDGVILVLRMSKKARPAAERARELLHAVGANIIGVAVNGVATRSGDGYGYSYQYQYQYEYADSYADSAEDAEMIDAGGRTAGKG